VVAEGAVWEGFTAKEKLVGSTSSPSLRA